MLNQLKYKEGFRFHPKCRSLNLTHRCFADDMIMCYAADVSSACIVKETIDSFSATSGLFVNPQKTQIFFSGVENHVKQDILQLVGFCEGNLPVKYLGLHLSASKLCRSDCRPITDKIIVKFSAWSTKHLTYAGRTQLISFVLFHYQTFWSLVFILPQSIVKDIERLCKNFLWGKRHMALVAWEKLSLPKSEGGLGFKQLKVWNRAATGRQLWKILHHDECLWTRWARAVYLKGTNIWLAKPKDRFPWSWRKLLKLRDNFYQHTQTLLGDGRHALLFYDRWLNGDAIATVTGDAICSWGTHSKVAQWWSQDTGWNIPASFSRNYPSISNAIMQLVPSMQEDVVIWKLSSSGNYSILSYYEPFRKSGSKVNWDHLVWSAQTLPKFSFIMWLLFHNSLKAKCLLQQRGMQIDLNCCFCNSHPETSDHQFFECTRQVWISILNRFGYVSRSRFG